MTGDLTPDATGTYENAGEYSGKRYYQRVPDDWFIWWDGDDAWTISAELGIGPPNSWLRIDPDIEGLYLPILPATGDATVTAGEH